MDALLLSGDLYDGEQTSMKTARFLADQTHRLHEAGIRVFVIRGNHDALSRITRELTLPDSVTIFGGRASAVAVERERGALPVTIHGVSFAQPHAPESLLGRFKPPVADTVNIGLLHTSLGGAAGHDLYAPCEMADLQRAGFRYWALGHIHQRITTEGEATVVMPGMPQGRDIGEAGEKSVTLATVGDDGAIRVEARRTCVAQFESVTVDLDGTGTWREMVGRLERALGQARDSVASEHFVARVKLTGTTALAWRLRRELDLLRTEAESRAAGLGRTWIDKVEVNCRPRAASPDQTTLTAGDPLEELRRLMGDVALDDGYRTEIAAIADELRAQLPPDCRDVFGHDQDSFAASVSLAAREGIDDVLARLQARAGTEPG